MKKYIKPDVEIVEFSIDEEITTIIDGSMGLDDGEEGWGN